MWNIHSVQTLDFSLKFETEFQFDISKLSSQANYDDFQA